MNSNICKALADSIKQLKGEEILLLEKEKQKLVVLTFEKIEEFKALGIPLPLIIAVVQVFADREYELKREIANKKKQLEFLSVQEQQILNLPVGNLTVVSQNPVAECGEILKALARRR